MGNCLLVVQQKSVNVMRTDGTIIEYKSPIKVHQVLSQFTHHAISDKLPIVKHMHPNDEMLRGRLYYLLPLPQPETKKNKKIKKTVRFADDVFKENEEEEVEKTSGVVRIKLVISKQELQAMLAERGVSVEDMIISQVHKETSTIKIHRDDDGHMFPQGTLPALESIPE